MDEEERAAKALTGGGEPFIENGRILVAQSHTTLLALSDEHWSALGGSLPRCTQRIGTDPQCPPGSVYGLARDDWREEQEKRKPLGKKEA